MQTIQTWIKSGKIKKIAVLLILLSFFIQTFSFADEETITEILEYKRNQTGFFEGPFYDSAGTSASDWYALCAGRLGLLVDSQAYVDYVGKNEADSSQKKVTDYARQSLSLVALAKDPRNSLSTDLITEGIASKTIDQLVEQGLNGAIFSLLALDSHHFSLDNAKFTRLDLLEEIASHQQLDGGFSLWLGESDVDITAMCIQALAPYQNLEQPLIYEGIISKKTETKRVYDVISDALVFLKNSQEPNGQYLSWGIESQESLAQVLIALYSTGREDSFSQSLWDLLLEYQNDDGGFFHSRQDDVDNPYAKAFVSNPMSSEQALLASVSKLRYDKKLNRLYDMTSERREGIREEIIKLNEDILDSTNDQQQLYQRYLQLSADDRSYVFNYEELRKKIVDKEYFQTEDDLLAVMGKEDSFFEEPRPLIENKYTGSKESFDEEDLGLAKQLISAHTLENRLEIEELIYRYDRKREVEATEIIQQLRDIQNEMNQQIDEVENLNRQLLSLYPLDMISPDKEDIIRNLYEQTKNFSPQQIKMIGGYEDLKQAAMRLETNFRSTVLRWIVVVIVLLLVLLIFRIVYKWRKDKNWKDQDLG